MTHSWTCSCSPLLPLKAWLVLTCFGVGPELGLLLEEVPEMAPRLLEMTPEIARDASPLFPGPGGGGRVGG